ncbi:aromatic ring-hydroxylating dioxygenase subunit alpha [Halioxenophilus sp. WMMB6]|uniref:aromatic ring-hydroxylating oxygenase subunit alpha n=1 Tax=Halioxenophilus sp. WMMB6 TaxID=3073815 RepID=UPI00295E914E|nr:aromatic ring-hydroxylating dioxygenase subunit alpha [Halioxenophilus sp. WMMB6]
MNNRVNIEELSEPLTFPTDAYVSKEYAEAEADKLWAKVWQHAGRVEEIPNVGDYITYEICHDSIIITRTGPDTIKAYHNVCPHRGRRLVSTPKGSNGVSGNTQVFTCSYHGWAFNGDGENTYILDKKDWQDKLTHARTCLTEVKVDTWGGWLWINMDPDCVPLREYLEPAASMLDPFKFEQMRYRFRQYVVFDCNWKVALEAFMEPYHVAATHPQLTKYGDFYAWSKAQGLHGNDGYDTPDHSTDDSAATTTVHRTGKGHDARKMMGEMQKEFWETVGASTTQVLVDAALRLVDELPEGTPANEVHEHWLNSCKADYAAMGIEWPEISDDEMAKAGLAWHVFPNMGILQGPTFALCYRTRPFGTDPDKCIYEAIAIERYPEGEQPNTEWVFADPTEENWRMVIAQDFSNMEQVQLGLKSRGFRGNLPNPHQERKVTNLHRNLAKYMGVGEPKPLN